jgi:protoporphyrin/coproporphyrin ferrochelatase
MQTVKDAQEVVPESVYFNRFANVLRGKNVPRERMEQVARQYEAFGGVSPLNANNKRLIEALDAELKRQGINLPIYFGNRNWHPMLADTLRQMKNDGIKKALAFVTSAYSSYSGCRQYLEDIEAAQDAVGQGYPLIEKLRSFFNHPGFIEANAANLREALIEIPIEKHVETHLVFTAHSIPISMASTCKYKEQLEETCRLVADAVGHPSYRLSFQSRSGPPTQSWLEPDILRTLQDLKDEGAEYVIVMPIGFLCDHMEVLFDLDTQAKELSKQLGINMVRAKTVGTSDRFIKTVCELIEERLEGKEPISIGSMPASPNVCAIDCCPNLHRH